MFAVMAARFCQLAEIDGKAKLYSVKEKRQKVGSATYMHRNFKPVSLGDESLYIRILFLGFGLCLRHSRRKMQMRKVHRERREVNKIRRKKKVKYNIVGKASTSKKFVKSFI